MKNQIGNIEFKCAPCNLEERIANLTVCKKCKFKMGRDGAYLKKHKISKSHLFYFLHNPELEFELPYLPEEDFLGTKRRGKFWRWEIHHEDGNHWNDS